MKPLALSLSIIFAAASAPPPDATFRPWTGTPTRGDFTVLVTEVHDGDSCTACLLVPVKVRVFGINAPELRDSGGAAAQKYLSDAIKGKQFPARFYGVEKYGRTLGDIAIDGGWLSAKLIAAGQAKPYDGHGPRP
jgi:endonuclease YncB( thermonuclease family)